MKMRVVIIAIGLIAAAFGVAAPAGADPADDPCQLAVSFLCRFVPMDHDVDLTQDPGALNGQPLPEPPSGEPAPEPAPPADLCVNGCA